MGKINYHYIRDAIDICVPRFFVDGKHSKKEMN
jgi:hypothetical protein